MKPKVYLETTIPSFLTAKPSGDLVLAAQQQLTLRWWETCRTHFSLFISELVLAEAAKGDPEAARRRLEAVAEIPLLEIDRKTIDLGGIILESGAIPKKAAADAGHVALAARHGIEYLLTWNCRHIANAQIVRDLDRVIRSTGLTPPTICTPNELFEREAHE